MSVFTIRRLVFAAICLLVFLPLLSCSSDDENPVVPVDTTLGASGTIGPTGGTIMSTDGRLVLTVPPGALAAATDIVITEVVAKDLTATAEGMEVIHAFTLEPANLELAEPMILELRSEDTEGGSPGKDVEVGPEAPLPLGMAGASDSEGELYRALPEQDLTYGPVNSQWLLKLVLPLIPQDLAIGFVLGTLGGLPGGAYLALGQELPAQPIENTQFRAQVAFYVSAALLLNQDIRFGPAIMENLTTLLEENDVIDAQTDVDPDGLQRTYALLNYVAGVPGPATWNLALRAEFEFQAAILFPNAQSLPRVWGFFQVLFYFAPASLAIQEVNPGGSLTPGLYTVSAGPEGARTTRGLNGFPYNNVLGISGANGTSIFSMIPFVSPEEIFLDFVIQEFLIWGHVMMSRNRLLDEKDVDLASIAMVQFGPGGARLTQWIPEDNAFGFTGILEFQSSVTDVNPFDDDPQSGGFAYVAGLYNAVRMLEYNPESGFWDINRQITNFPEAPGAPFSAAVRRDGGALVVTEGTPGRIYHHDLVDLLAPAVAIGDAGNSPRRIRTAGDLAFISNFESDELTVLSWNGVGAPTLIGSIPVGDGPVGIDALELTGGNVAVVSTGFNDNTSTVTVVDTAGSVISNTTTELPTGALAPGHAFWLRGDSMNYGVTCSGSDHLVVIDPGLN